MKLLDTVEKRAPRILICFGTRPELIKFAPLIRVLRSRQIAPVVVNSGQHTDLLTPLFELFQIRPEFTLDAMQPGQSLNALGSRLLSLLDPVL
ncbi:MAG TPA: UDP-N-acetylglucosamine 2-epimerase (non-hydrolyzing), partial [Candidatus Gracilibacteria bacterium]|nr:UDP-N-acetylglucosamine 2-epimerase (non-hydrolyzing) [Candidatus Gracilibacteria bacterium]